jgi:dTDP-4-amino-4,6-dideoxygalactose transaminase
MYYLLLPTLEHRQALISHLKNQGILAVFHYLPLHSTDMGRQFGGRRGACPVTDDISDRLLRLPFFASLADTDLAIVVEAIRAFDKL